MFRQLRQFDFNKLGKNILGAILTPPATVFATTGDADKAKHAGLLGQGAAALIVIGFIQQPYKSASEAVLAKSKEANPSEMGGLKGSDPKP